MATKGSCTYLVLLRDGSKPEIIARLHGITETYALETVLRYLVFPCRGETRIKSLC